MKGTSLSICLALSVALLAACSPPKQSTSPPIGEKAPSPPKVTPATFEPVYRAAKGLQGATMSGVSYVKFGELMQVLSTEISIAKDHQLNDADKKILALYQEAFDQYQISGSLWKMKLNVNADTWKGEIPFAFENKPDATMMKVAETYKIPVSDRRLAVTGVRYKALPGDSVQRVWRTADATLQKATDLYYGK